MFREVGMGMLGKIQQQFFRYGYGSIPIFIPFLVG